MLPNRHKQGCLCGLGHRLGQQRQRIIRHAGVARDLTDLWRFNPALVINDNGLRGLNGFMALLGHQRQRIKRI